MIVVRTVPLADGSEAKVFLREKALLRLDTTCFRHGDLPRSGNFSEWRRAGDLLHDALILEEIAGTIEELVAEDSFGTQSVTIDYGRVIGWTSTAPLGDFPEGDLEEFYPNRHSVALRVKSASQHFAPQTSKLTIVFEFKLEDERPVLVIHSMYPGEDIGKLHGNVSRREEVAFFSWDHPGAVP